MNFFEFTERAWKNELKPNEFHPVVIVKKYKLTTIIDDLIAFIPSFANVTGNF